MRQEPVAAPASAIEQLTPSVVLKQKGLGSIAFSPNSERLLTRMDDGTLVAWELASGTRAGPSYAPGHKGTPGQSKFHFLPQGRVGFTGNGSHVLALSPGAVSVWDAATGELVLTKKDLDHTTATPDGLLIAYQARSSITLWDVAARQPRGEPIQGDLGGFSNDGHALLYRAGREIRILTLASGRTVVLPNHDPKHFAWWAWGQDAATLAAFDEGRSPVIWNVAYDPPVERIALKTTGYYPGFSPDGRFFATVQPEGITLQALGTAEPESHLLAGPYNATFTQRFPRYFFAANQQLVATMHFKGLTLSDKNYSIQLWDLQPRRPVLLQAIPESQVIGFTRDGATLAYKHARGGIGLWSSKTRSNVAFLQTGRKRVDCYFSDSRVELESANLSPDGSWFACSPLQKRDEILVWNLRSVR